MASVASELKATVWSIKSGFAANGLVIEILLDSIILIDHFNSHRAATAYLNLVQPEAAVSVVTRAEVLTGVSPAEMPQALSVVDLFSPLVPLGRRCPW